MHCPNKLFEENEVQLKKIVINNCVLMRIDKTCMLQVCCIGDEREHRYDQANKSLVAHIKSYIMTKNVNKTYTCIEISDSSFRYW